MRDCPLILCLFGLSLLACRDSVHTEKNTQSLSGRRVPAEWEPQAAVWLQWPAAWEGGAVEKAFVDIVSVLVQYESVHLVVGSENHQSQALEALTLIDQDNIEFHIIPINSSWMRDNGPRYIEENGELHLQNWEFNGWNLPNVPYDRDNAVPESIAELLNMPLEHIDLIHERGDLEANGQDTIMVSWTVLSDRNPNLSQAEVSDILRSATGADSVVYIEGHDPLDITLGHVDGMARFVSADTIVVGQNGSELMDTVALQIAAQRPDLHIDRLTADTAGILMNWLVGDGFVLVGDSHSEADNATAEQLLNQYFPERTVHFVNVNALWMNGGGVHCVTNDQPE